MQCDDIYDPQPFVGFRKNVSFFVIIGKSGAALGFMDSVDKVEKEGERGTCQRVGIIDVASGVGSS